MPVTPTRATPLNSDSQSVSSQVEQVEVSTTALIGRELVMGRSGVPENKDRWFGDSVHSGVL